MKDIVESITCFLSKSYGWVTGYGNVLLRPADRDPVEKKESTSPRSKTRKHGEKWREARGYHDSFVRDDEQDYDPDHPNSGELIIDEEPKIPVQPGADENMSDEELKGAMLFEVDGTT